MSFNSLVFKMHPLAGREETLQGPNGPLTIRMPEQTYFAMAGNKYSFTVMNDAQFGWELSWQDQENGGSASNTREGPFRDRFSAEARCRHILRELQQKH